MKMPNVADTWCMQMYLVCRCASPWEAILDRKNTATAVAWRWVPEGVCWGGGWPVAITGLPALLPHCWCGADEERGGGHSSRAGPAHAQGMETIEGDDLWRTLRSAKKHLFVWNWFILALQHICMLTVNLYTVYSLLTYHTNDPLYILASTFCVLEPLYCFTIRMLNKMVCGYRQLKWTIKNLKEHFHPFPVPPHYMHAHIPFILMYRYVNLVWR